MQTKNRVGVLHLALLLTAIGLFAWALNKLVRSTALQVREKFGCDALKGIVHSLDGEKADLPYDSASTSRSILKWTKSPKNKVVGGYENGVNQYVCQGFVQDNVYSGKTWDGYPHCNVAIDDQEVPCDDFTYLDSNAPMFWSKSPSKKVVGGNAKGQKLYVCHADWLGGKHVGLSSAGSATCDFGYGGKKTSVADFEYLSEPGPRKEQNSYHMSTVKHLDNWGSDFKDFDGDQNTCATVCLNTPACSVASSNGTHCWLKNNITPGTLRKANDINSLMRLSDSTKGVNFTATDYPNNDIANVAVDSDQDCFNLCGALNSCKAAAFDTSGTGSCWLKSKAETATVNHDRLSYVKQ